MPEPFDLSAAVASWRRRLERSRTLRRSELDELEAHLFDVVDERTAAGLCEREAFEAALWQLGHASLLEATFRQAHEAERGERPPWQHPRWVPVMLKSYVTVALRALRRQPGYAFINVFGLGLGLAASLVILLYAHHELTYDRFHPQAGRIHLVLKDRITPAGTQVTRDTWVPLAERLKQEFPSVEAAVRLWEGQEWVRHGETRFREGVTYTDASLWDVFHFPLALGDPATAFRDPYAVVVSQDVARKYFGSPEAALGQTLLVDNTTTYTVTGVFEEVPTNSSLRIGLAVPLASSPEYVELSGDWSSSFLSTYVLLREGADPAALEAQLPGLVARIFDPEETARTVFHLEALPDYWNNVTGNRAYAYLLVGVAAAILLIASINFTNLSTARSLERSREIGMRKVLGAGRRQLVGQFIGESMVMSFSALAVGVLMAEAALPFFEDLYAIELGLPYVRQPLVLLLLAGMGAGIGLLAGAYPALVLSGFQPIGALQGRFKSGRSGRVLRHGLVVTQFTLATALIMGTLLVRTQIGFLQHANLRFEQDNLLVLSVSPDDFEGPGEAAVRLETFKDELQKLGGVVSVTSSSHVPGNWDRWFTFIYPGNGTDEDRLRLRYAFADHRFFDTYGLPLVEGRSFDEARPTDQDEAVVLNEAALKVFGWASAEGKTVRRGERHYQVIGVVRDYHFETLQNAIEPVVHFYRPPESGLHQFVSVRLRPEHVPATLAGVEALWRKVDPGRPLPYTFASEQFARLYEAEERLATVAGAFTLLAILVACLGLFGLASWMAAQRVKEVGIRKALGASATGIALLLSGQFARLVLVAVVLAVPLAYAGLDAWLAGFAYRIDLARHAFVFAAAGAAALLLALATVSYQAIRAALSDPVKALRHE